MLPPKEAGKFIADNAKHVYLHQEQVLATAKRIATAVTKKELDIEGFKQNEVIPLDKGLTKEQLSNWIFMVDAINFSFWTPKGEPKFTVTYSGKKRSGYMAMVSAVNRAIDEGHKMYDPKYYSKLTVEDLKLIFRSDTDSPMPLFNERVKVLHEIGACLEEKYNGTFLTVLKKADGNAQKLVDIVSKNFDCFHDVAKYDGKDVAIFKRVQILVADIWMLFRGEGLGSFKDIDTLTMFADYRVPQVLVHFGVLTYSDALMKKLEEEHLFLNGDLEEVEIRGCSIHAVDLIVEETRKILEKTDKMAAASVNSIKVDFFLWDYRISHAEELEPIPYHKVRCIYY